MTWAVIGGVILALLAGGYFLAKGKGAAKERERQRKANEDVKKEFNKVPKRGQSDTADRMRKRRKRGS